MNNPVVSIIIATYNSEKTIRTSLESVKNQIFQEWECIVIDGASCDGTVNIVKEYVEKDSRIHYVSEKDNGVYDAFNRGWRMAKGEWVHYLGSDDWLTKDSFSQLLVGDCDKFGIVSGDVRIERVDGTSKLNVSDGFDGCHQGKIVRRTVLEQMGGFDERFRILSDKDLMIRMEQAAIPILNVRSVVAHFSMGGLSQRPRDEWSRFKERVKIYKKNRVTTFPIIVCSLLHFKIIMSVIYRHYKSKFNSQT